MFFRILKKDILRQKGFYFILFILIFLSISLFCSGLCLVYYSTLGASSFLDKSNLSDIIIVKQGDEQENINIRNWTELNSDIIELNITPTLDVTNTIFMSDMYLPNGTNLMIMESNSTQNLLFDENNQILSVPEGKIAFPVILGQQIGLQIGDIVTFKSQNSTKEISFIISNFFKDALMGSDGMSSRRAIVNHNDMIKLISTIDAKSDYMIQILIDNLSDSLKLLSDYQREGFTVSYSFQKDTINAIYLASNGIIAILFVITALFLFLILLFCLNFSIRSTLSEDVKQIGFLKAIGLRNYKISNLYMIKYNSISSVAIFLGGITGYFLSIVLAKKMLEQMLPIMPFIPLLLITLASSLIFILCILFCRILLYRIRTYTPTEILGGKDNLSSFFISPFGFLNQHRKTPVTLFLAFNDIFCGLKSWIVLAATFVFCIILMTISLNFKNSLTGVELVKYFGCTPADFYYFPQGFNTTLEETLEVVHNIEKKFKQNNEPIQTGIDYSYNIIWKSNTGDESLPIRALLSSKPVTEFSFIDGHAPLDSDEIALTTILLKQYGLNVGDIGNFQFEGEEVSRQFKISGSFQAMYNMGELILLNSQFNSKAATITSILPLITLNQKDVDNNILIQHLFDKYSEIGEIKPITDYVSEMTGGLDQQIGFVALIVCALSTLILALMVLANSRLLLYKDTSSIAMMKALGFSSHLIFLWQGARICLLLLFSFLIGIPIANTAGELLMQKLFSFTGLTNLTFYIDIIQIYIILPIFLFGVCFLCFLPILRGITQICIKQIRMET